MGAKVYGLGLGIEVPSIVGRAPSIFPSKGPCKFTPSGTIDFSSKPHSMSPTYPNSQQSGAIPNLEP